MLDAPYSSLLVEYAPHLLLLVEHALFLSVPCIHFQVFLQMALDSHYLALNAVHPDSDSPANYLLYYKASLGRWIALTSTEEAAMSVC